MCNTFLQDLANIKGDPGKPIPVVQVKPEVETDTLIAQLAARVGVIFLAGWLLNMIIPAVTPWELGYWQCIWLYIGSNILFKRPRPILNRFKDLKDK